MTIDVEQLHALWRQAFGDTEEFTDSFFRAGFSPERCRYIQQDGKIAAALYWFDCFWEGRKTAYIYGVATDKAYRGQGLCRQLMAHAHKHLQAEGYTGAVLVPAGDSLFAMYEKMGYRGFCPTAKQEILPGVAAKIVAIGPEEYERLRNARLPAGSVLQGQDALAFYGTYGSFYRCDSGIFCAAREGETLYVQEFLGDPEALSGIVAALDCNAAQVRIPGGERPFAMYYSFTEDKGLPEYFGIALD